MPAMHFTLRWPDGRSLRCYSPSLVIKDHFEPGRDYAVPEFLQSVREALHVASERVRAKYGFACSMALDQLRQIEEQAAAFAPLPGAQVRVVAFDEEPV